MLNKYFVYEDFKIDLNRPELLLVKEFESLMDIKYNKCDEYIKLCVNLIGI